MKSFYDTYSLESYCKFFNLINKKYYDIVRNVKINQFYMIDEKFMMNITLSMIFVEYCLFKSNHRIFNCCASIPKIPGCLYSNQCPNAIYLSYMYTYYLAKMNYMNNNNNTQINLLSNVGVPLWDVLNTILNKGLLSANIHIEYFISSQQFNTPTNTNTDNIIYIQQSSLFFLLNDNVDISLLFNEFINIYLQKQVVEFKIIKNIFPNNQFNILSKYYTQTITENIVSNSIALKFDKIFFDPLHLKPSDIVKRIFNAILGAITFGIESIFY